MEPAWIAVIGTLSGVVVTSVSAIVLAFVNLRSQQRTIELQRSHELWERRREERREAFVEYLAAYSELREKILALHQQAEVPHAQLVDMYPAETSRFSRSYQALRIFCSVETGAAAHETSSHLWDLADAIRTRDQQAFVDDRETGRRLRRNLRAAMQVDLGIVAPATA